MTFNWTTDMPKEPISIRGTAYCSRKEAAKAKKAAKGKGKK